MKNDTQPSATESRGSGFAPIAGHKASKTYCHLAGSWPFDCWDGVQSAAVIGIMLPNGNRADYIAFGSSRAKADAAMKKAGWKLVDDTIFQPEMTVINPNDFDMEGGAS